MKNSSKKEQILNIINSNKNRFSVIIKNEIELYEEIKKETFFLNIKEKKNKIKIIERIYCYLNNIIENKKCLNENCNNFVNFTNFKKGYKEYCSQKCANTCKKRKESIKKTNLEKYGTTTPLQNEEIKRIREKKNIQNFGTKENFASNKHKNKMKENNLKRYGVEYYFKSNDFLKKQYIKSYRYLKNKLLKFDILIDLDEKSFEGLVNGIFTKNKKERYQNKKIFKFKCLKCNHLYKDHLLDNYIPYCEKCDKKNNSSIVELEFLKFLEELNIKFKRNDRTQIKPFEIDFLIDNLGIEINGVYYHSYQFLNKKELSENSKILFNKHKLPLNRGKYYHYLKTELSKEKNIFLYSIYDLEWINPIKREIIKSVILYKLKKIKNNINARECDIKEVSQKEKELFLEENHLQGNCISKTNLGLYFKNELVSLMTFGNSRFEKDKIELLRFANKKFFNVRGGASKLFKYFLINKNKENKNIISFADRRYSNGNLYKKLEFKYIHTTKANYKYFKNKNFYNRMVFQKKNIKEYKETNKYNIFYFDETLNERDNMFKNGYKQIYDSGQIKFEFFL